MVTSVSNPAGATRLVDLSTVGTLSPSDLILITDVSENNKAKKSTVQSIVDFVTSSGSVASVFGRTGIVAATADDYAASQITNDSAAAGPYVKEALDNIAASVSSNNSAISTLNSTVTDLSTSVSALNSSVSANTTSIAANTSSISVLSTSVSSLNSAVSAINTSLTGKFDTATFGVTGLAVASAGTATSARSVLGLGTAATQNSTAFLASTAGLNDLSDVSSASAAINQYLQYTGTEWKPVSISSTAGTTALSALTDVSVSGVTNGQVLTYNTSSGLWIPTSISSGGGGGSPGGSDGNIQYNSSGSFAGSSLLNFSEFNTSIDPNGSSLLQLIAAPYDTSSGFGGDATFDIQANSPDNIFATANLNVHANNVLVSVSAHGNVQSGIFSEAGDIQFNYYAAAGGFDSNIVGAGGSVTIDVSAQDDVTLRLGKEAQFGTELDIAGVAFAAFYDVSADIDFLNITSNNSNSSSLNIQIGAGTIQSRHFTTSSGNLFDYSTAYAFLKQVETTTSVFGNIDISDSWPVASGKVVTINASTTVEQTLPATLPPGFNIRFIQTGTAPIRLSAETGATLHQRQGFTKTAGQYGYIDLVVIANATNSAASYVATGDMV